MPASELPIDTSATALQMAQEIFGDDTIITGANYFGWGQSSGIYSNGDSVSGDLTPGDTGVILSTGRATDVTNSSGQENQNTNTSTNTPGVNNDALFNAMAGGSTFDAAILEIEFIPTSPTFTIQFTYSSEEYPEFVNSIYNDLVGVWINGAPVDLAVGDGNSNIGNVNDGNNQNLYQDNTGDQFNTEMDGFTITLTLTIPVNVGDVNTLRIGIADVGDSNYDSNLLIAGGSFQDDVIAYDDSFDIVQNGTPTIDVLANDFESSGGTLTISQINGQDVSVGDTITLATGQEITLNADGTLGIVNDADLESVTFTYQVDNGSGVTDTAFVTINTIPCFVSGTQIRTPEGERPVEELQPGDLVDTLDDGPQEIRWIGRRKVRAEGSMVPVHIRANTFGKHGDLWISPQHRVLVKDRKAELLFGEDEVLVAAKDLVNDNTVLRDASHADVEYVHILFDEHQVVYSEGLETESFHPGPQTLQSFDAPVVEEICSIFPELDPETGDGYGASARTSLKAFEAQILLN